MLAIEIACLSILALAAALRSRGPDAGEWLRDAGWIGLAALIAEDTSIRLYGFYEYSPEWHLFADKTPLLIPTIWICVVLSARDVARLLAPRHALAALFFLVWYDASFIEPAATSAGLWSWKVPGPFGVPWIGIVGWAFFAAAAGWCLEKLPGRLRFLTLVVAPLATHAALLAAWWGFYRWVGRGQDVHAIAGFVAVGLLLVAAAVALRRAGTVPLWAVSPRVLPALFFFGLLTVKGAPPRLFLYAASFVLPWLTIIRWKWGAKREADGAVVAG